MSKPDRTVIRVRALLERDDHFLVAEYLPRRVMFLPGGRAFPGETLETAIRRELHEEAGANPETLTFLGMVENIWRPDGEPQHDINHYFVAHNHGVSETLPNCPDEGVMLHWKKRAELDTLPILPHAEKALLRHWWSGARTPWWRVENTESLGDLDPDIR